MAAHVLGQGRSGHRPDQIELPFRVRFSELVDLVDPLPVDVLSEIDETRRFGRAGAPRLVVAELDPVRDHG